MGPGNLIFAVRVHRGIVAAKARPKQRRGGGVVLGDGRRSVGGDGDEWGEREGGGRRRGDRRGDTAVVST